MSGPVRSMVVWCHDWPVQAVGAHPTEPVAVIVANRIVAKPGAKDYGRLAVLSQWRTQPRILFKLPGAAFTPRPKVDSALVELLPRATPEPACDVEALEKVTAAMFGQRRKMLRASLRQLTPDTEELLERLEIDPKARAEDLAVADFCRITNALKEPRR